MTNFDLTTLAERYRQGLLCGFVGFRPIAPVARPATTDHMKARDQFVIRATSRHGSPHLTEGEF